MCTESAATDTSAGRQKRHVVWQMFFARKRSDSSIVGTCTSLCGGRPESKASFQLSTEGRCFLRESEATAADRDLEGLGAVAGS
ncbi:hypothetical protein D1B33_13775 [Lysinibacillus yapensis]|uniref:Uncharacterized protein n=1 Tax=Ureibacillus yapensis TaxID=2304605 RepID=A0A396S4V1_9BACL|nr:hypothetical protein D1B33_13775 [Lysinibacillus yapensis]